MAILIIAEHDHASLSDQTAKAVSAAAKIGGDIHVLVAGKNAKAAADAAAKLDGVSKVLHAEGDEYANRLAEPHFTTHAPAGVAVEPEQVVLELVDQHEVGRAVAHA